MKKSPQEYTVGWICALPLELAAAECMLDEFHEPLDRQPSDDNVYSFGRIGSHNVVIACLPAGVTGLVSAARVTDQLFRSFRHVKVGLMVGIGGGVPQRDIDIRLGDVVVSKPADSFGGVVQYDLGKTEQDGQFVRTGSLNSPPTILLNVLSKLDAKHRRQGHEIALYLSEVAEKFPRMASSTFYLGAQADQLFEAEYDHPKSEKSCENCDPLKRISRTERKEHGPVIHYGTIASGNQVVKHGSTRNRLSEELGVICFEMEAAGLLNSHPCLVIRGICDYSDSHKNKFWQEYAAMVAAAYAKDFLNTMPTEEVLDASHVTTRIEDENPSSKSDLRDATRIVFSQNPLRPVKNFVERLSLATKIRDELHSKERIENLESFILVIHGLGGVGKSQLVLNYLREYQTEYAACFWVAADSRESVERDFTQIYRLIFKKLNSTENSLPKIQDMILAVKSWFSEPGGRRMVVFDSADDIMDDDDRLSSFNIMNFLPDGPGLDIIITTRSSVARDISTAEAISVHEMEPNESMELFYKSAKLVKRNQDSDVLAIVEELGHLALAVTLAGHYISRAPSLRSNLKLYLPEYRQRRKELLSERPLRLIHQYGESVLTTWEASYRAIEDRSPAATRFLQLLAFMSPDDLYLFLFSCGQDSGDGFVLDDRQSWVLTYLRQKWHTFIFADETVGPYMIEEIFTLLEDYSLVQLRASTDDRTEAIANFASSCGSYQMHKLVHAWCYDRFESSKIPEAGVAALQLLYVAVIKTENKFTTGWRLVPHISKAIDVLSTHQSFSTVEYERFSELLWRLSKFLDKAGRIIEARSLRAFQVRCCASSLGTDHANTLVATNDLAYTLVEEGSYDEAQKLTQQVLERRQFLLGEDHPDTLSSLHNLASLLGQQGKHRDALKLNREITRKRQMILGEAHDDTITSFHNLACSLDKMGGFNEAEVLRRKVLKALESRHEKKESLPYLIAKQNLAQSLSNQGLFKEAAVMASEVVDVQKRVLGEEHPQTLASLNNEAVFLYKSGRYKEAASQHRRARDSRLRILGPRHPSTLQSMNDLANALSSLGETDEALPVYRELVAMSRQVLGEKHPDYLTRLTNLAIILQEQGSIDESNRVIQHVLDARRETLGENHIATWDSKNNLAHSLAAQGKTQEALDLSQSVLDYRKDNLGETHLDTVATMHCVANCLMDLNKSGEAINLQWKVLSVRQNVLGPDHRDTLLAELNLACFLSKVDDLEVAATMQEGLVAKYVTSYGDSFPETVTAKSNLAGILKLQGKLLRAAEIQRELLHSSEARVGGQHPKTLACMIDCASTLLEMGALEEAETLLRSLWGRRQVVLGDDHEDTLLPKTEVARILHKQGKFDEAKSLLEQVLSTTDKLLSSNQPNQTDIYQKRASVATGLLINTLWALGKYKEAQELEEASILTKVEEYGPEHRRVFVAKYNLAMHLVNHCGGDDQKQAEAKSLLRLVLDADKKVLPPDHDDLVLSMSNLALLLTAPKENDEREEMQKQVLETRIRVLGLSNQKTVNSMTDVVETLLKQGKETKAEKFLLGMLSRTAEQERQQDGRGRYDNMEMAVLGWIGEFYYRTGNLEKSFMHRKMELKLRAIHYGLNASNTQETLGQVIDLMEQLGKPAEHGKASRRVAKKSFL